LVRFNGRATFAAFLPGRHLVDCTWKSVQQNGAAVCRAGYSDDLGGELMHKLYAGHRHVEIAMVVDDGAAVDVLSSQVVQPAAHGNIA